MTQIEWLENMTKQERLDQTFMRFAEDLSKLSHCLRVQVGAVIVRDGRVISTGYNGSPPGFENCSHHFKDRVHEIDSEEFRKDHGEWSIHEVHGEMNALLFAAKHGQKVDGATIYTTTSPCMNCAKAIITSGIKRVVYLKAYDRDIYPLSFLEECGVDVEQLSSKPR